MKADLKIFNTLSGKKEPLKPTKGKRVNLFVCGATVYDYPHLGHARNYIVFDSFAKYLKKIGYNVFYLQNITDLDDKIIMRAREKEVSPKDLAVAFEKEYFKSMKMLGVNSVSKYVRATSCIKEIISQIKRLTDKGYAYKIDNDGIYYDISKFKNYGKLSGRTALQAEDSISRIDYSKDKKNRGDFCLWKFSEENEPSWPSPFGRGRPGWHIEDTAITEKFLGPQYDIHGGARDLIFPHHEAEISQMEAISGKNPMAKYWMHVGFLTIEGQKMSKSLGNFISIDDFLRRHPANYLRFFALKNLWRSPIDYFESTMIEVKSAVEKIEEFLRKLKSPASAKASAGNAKLAKRLRADFYSQLDDDFNTPKAFAVLFDFIKKENRLLEKNLVSKKESVEIYKFFEEINDIFGIIDFKRINRAIPVKIKKLAQAREKFRKNQEWQKADQARQEIEKQGFVIEDTKDGPSVKPIT
ncbi:MAG: cysteine--tRNA ligase [Candidatus Staskawiczbacteria bacterium RIFCSPHIGHO2_01_FULL_36_16]|uniref:Cysteine--tRNA ligase n=1 Tax=Candidatus Staskawiczbacteria bacterium RIFCSPHIGHO2_01_FULL_36_16 TaxID=1802200 RepID=A0A1G2HSK6_9BACT|nr:MAG: cysteine--tRNA ligase [Candidatus Staskawiczbacteria bacterium RIFCSPHIGHO2_01_FULL_36_16]